MPPPPPGAPGPFALSTGDALESLLAQAGLRSVTVADVPAPWEYDDDEIAMRGLISSGPVVKAIQHAGEDAVRAAIVAGIADRHREGGGYRLENTFRYAMGTVER
jgi:hypothetical protein